MYVVLNICLFEQEVYFKQYTSKKKNSNNIWIT